jgi:hypothetical protein
MEIDMMKKSFMLAAAAGLLTVGAPAAAGDKVLKSTAIGAGAGALVGAVVPGISTGTGALVGAGTGLAVGAINKNKNKHRDRYGRSYWVDKHGRRHYR